MANSADVANKSKTPRKTCRECGARVHVRNRTCDQCGFEFSPCKSTPLTTDESLDSVVMALKLVKRLGETEAIKLIRKVSEATHRP